MAIQLNLGNQHYASTRPTYIGRPVEAIQQTNAILNNRYVNNKAAYQANIDALNALDVEKQNKGIVQEQADSTKHLFKDVIDNNQFEFADNIVSTATNEIKGNKELKGAVVSQATRKAWSADLDERVKNGKMPADVADRLKNEGSALNYKRLTVDEDGVIHNSFSAPTAVDNPDIQKQVMDYASKLKASKIPLEVNGRKMSYANGSYYYADTKKSIPEAEATAAITQMVMSDPKNKAWFQQENRLEDNSMIVRNDDGTFKLDNKGNPIVDINQMNQKNRLLNLGFTDKDIETRLEEQAKLEGGNTMKVSNLTPERKQEFYKAMYDQYRNYAKVKKIAAAGVNIVDYTEIDRKFYSNPLTALRLKRKWDKEDAALAIQANPRFDVLVAPENGNPQSYKDFMKTRETAANNVVASHNRLTSAAVSAGLIDPSKGESIQYRNYDGHKTPVIVRANGTLVPINQADKNGKVMQQYITGYAEDQKQKELVDINTKAYEKAGLDLGGNVTSERWNAIQKQVWNNTAKVYRAIPLTGTDVGKPFMAAATSQVIFNYQSATTLNGKRAFEDDSDGATGDAIKEAIANGDLRIGVALIKGKPKYIVQGTYKQKGEDDLQHAITTEFVVDGDPRVLNSLETPIEQVHTNYSTQLQDVFSNSVNDFETVTMNVGTPDAPIQMKVSRLPYDETGKELSKANPNYAKFKRESKYKVEVTSAEGTTVMTTDGIDNAANLATKIRTSKGGVTTSKNGKLPKQYTTYQMTPYGAENAQTYPI